jgi:hypothetical protein
MQNSTLEIDFHFGFGATYVLTPEEAAERKGRRDARSIRARRGWYKEMEASGLDEDAAKVAARNAAGPR